MILNHFFYYNISLWLDNNIFKPNYKLMNQIKLIRNILNEFYKDIKKIKRYKIRQAIIKL